MPDAPDLGALRRDYAQGSLDEATAPADPFVLAAAWLADAAADGSTEAGAAEANAATLATVDADGRPSARVVLVKGLGTDGFRFFTNYEGRKGAALAADPRAALCFWWSKQERQLRVEGTVARLSAAESDAYFNARPRGARLGASASPQSRVVPDRAFLESRARAADERFRDTDPPRPAHWGGYLLVPETIEAWQGRPDRLHDRIRWRRAAGGWIRERLAP